MIPLQVRRLYACWPVKRGMIATGQNQDRYLAGDRATNWDPAAPEKHPSGNVKLYPGRAGGSPNGLDYTHEIFVKSPRPQSSLHFPGETCPILTLW